MDLSERTLSLRLLSTRDRPFFAYKSGEMEVLALMESGALTPVWCMGAGKFLAAYPDAIKKQGEKCRVAGFGENPLQGDVYVIPQFELQDNKSTYKIINLQVAVCDHPQIGCDFVLSDTMFSKTDTLIMRRGKRRIDIVFDKDEYHCTPRYEDDRFTVTTWAQDETNGE